MDSLSRLTTRQRLRRLRFGFPRAVRLLIAAAVVLLVGGFLAGLSFSAHAIGTVPGTSILTVMKEVMATPNTRGCGSTTPGSVNIGPMLPASGAAEAWVQMKTNMDSYTCPMGSEYAQQLQFAVAYTVQSVASDGNSFVYRRVTTTTDINQYCSANCTQISETTQTMGLQNVNTYVTTCSGTSSAAGAVCECNNGSKPNTATPATCQPYTCEVKPLGEYNYVGTGVNVGTVPLTFTQPGYICDTLADAQTQQGARPGYGCSSTVELKMVSQIDGETNKTFVMSEVQNGKTCQGGTGVAASSAASGVSTTAAHPPASATPCAAGTCPGTINGASVCRACSQTTSGGGSSTAASGAATGASGPAVTSTSDSNTTKQTTCVGNLCTTTTTTTSATGSSSGTSGTGVTTTTKTDSKSGFCAENPGDAQCGAGGNGGGGEGGSGGWGGTCQAGFACQGDVDPITCAIAVEQHRRDCQFWGEDDGTAAARGTAAAIAGDTPGDHPGKTENRTSQAVTFDSTDLLGGGCPSDLSVSMPGGGHVMLPLSALCAPASWLGNLLVGITALACLGIAFKGS